MGESRNAYRVLVGRPEGKRPLERPRRRWEDNIKMGLRDVGYDGKDWINLTQNRARWRAYVRAAMNLRPYFAASLAKAETHAENIKCIAETLGTWNQETGTEKRSNCTIGDTTRIIPKKIHQSITRIELLLNMHQNSRSSFPGASRGEQGPRFVARALQPSCSLPRPAAAAAGAGPPRAPAQPPRPARHRLLQGLQLRRRESEKVLPAASAGALRPRGAPGRRGVLGLRLRCRGLVTKSVLGLMTPHSCAWCSLRSTLFLGNGSSRYCSISGDSPPSVPCFCGPRTSFPEKAHLRRTR
ncbi:hypothetical protein ANN_07328 [Periplaneta americana]|uniref:Uncharacterized protein n=1 Tax=Periplaneta americana TaxID=6978 RepID=A0ABQ8SYB5_PERAM|nr:hypothetical protein ANN_07328 [Periplaneta americana]